MHARRALAGVRRFALLAALALGALAVAPAARAADAPADRICLEGAAVCLEIRERGAFVSFVVSNATPAPYSVRIAADELENLRPMAPLPFRGVIGPGEQATLGTLAPLDAKAETHYDFAWRAALGSMLARHDDRWHYRPPFGGGARRAVSQGYGGRTSHQGASQYALDFSMPWGTPVLAARAGSVVVVVDASFASGRRKLGDDRANQVTVLHADGTLATYAHLRHGAAVAAGDRVETGDLIGHSGDTGYGAGPHLHFMVWRRLPDLRMATLPVRFYDGTPQGVAPAPGMALAPGCAAAGPGCGEGYARPPSEAAPAPAAQVPRAARSSDGGCHCPNGAVIYVALPCSQVCAR